MRTLFQNLARAGVVAALIPFATCTDFTGPSGRGVQVPVVPAFSPAATFAKALYSSAGLEFDRVRVLILRGETVLKDTSVAFSATSAELTLPLVIAAAPGEVVTVTLEYRSADLLLYAGTASVTTLAVGAPATSPTPIVLVPVGPGSTADKVEISPTSGTYPVSGPVTFTAHALTATGTPISNAIFGWSVDDPTVATVNGQGVVQPTSKGGIAHVRATTLNGKFAEATATFVTAPASLAIASGGSQSAPAFEKLEAPVVVKVLDLNGNGVAGATVSFAVLSGGGTLTVLNEISDVSGLVSAKWTLGGEVGAHSIRATAAALPDAPLTITATATERPAVSLVFGQQPTTSIMGAAIMPAVTVKAFDDKGHIVAGFTGAVTIALEANPTSATLGGTATTSAIAGVATFSNLSVSAAGTGYTLKATSGQLTAATSASFGVDQVPAGLSLVSGGSQTAAIRSMLSQVVVTVADANGIGAPGVTVAFEVVSGGGSIVVNNGVTDAEGRARATWTLGDALGTQSIRATSGGLTGSPLTITAEATPLPAVILHFLQGPSNVVLNKTMTPSVTVKALNADGQIVTGFTGAIALTLESNPNSATLGGTTTVNAVNGVATFSTLTVNIAGTGYALKAISGTLTTATSGTFVVSPPTPVGLAFQVQPSNVVKSDAIAPAIQVRIVDADGATVPGATNEVAIGFAGAVDASISGPLTANAVNGVATFNDVHINTVLTSVALKATSLGLTQATSSSFAVAPANPTWVGAVSTSWEEPGNWSPARMPVSEDSVTILPGANQPTALGHVYPRAIAIASGATLRIKNAGFNTYTPKFYNRGTLRLTSATLTYGDVDNQGTLIIDETSGAKSITNFGAIDVTSANGSTTGVGVIDSLVNKTGATMTLSQGAGGGRFIEGVLRNYGAISSTSSSVLELNQHAAGSINAGSITLTNGGQLYQAFDDSTIVFTNTGTIALGTANYSLLNGNLKLRDGTVTGTGTFQPSGSQLDVDFAKFPLRFVVDQSTIFKGDSVVIPSGVTVKATGSKFTQRVNVAGTLKIEKVVGPIDFVGGLTIAGTGAVESEIAASVFDAFDIKLNGKLKLVATGAALTWHVANGFTNRGTIDMTSAGAWETIIEVANGALTNTGTINAVGGFGGERRLAAEVDNQGTISVAGDSYLKLRRGSGVHSNSGIITLADVPTLPTAGESAEHLTSFTIEGIESGSVFKNNGEIRIGNHRAVYVAPDNTLDNQVDRGVISGTGKLRVPDGGIFVGAGTIAPGGLDAIGTLTFEGDLSTGNTSTLEIDVADTPSSGKYDKLVVTGSAFILGSVRVKAPVVFPVDTWDVLTATTSLNGDFNVTGPTLAWWGTADQDNKVLRVSNVLLQGPPPR